MTDTQFATKSAILAMVVFARVTTQAQQVWEQAKKANDFAAFRPSLEKVVELKRQEADAVGYNDHRYNALIEEYEPGTTVAELKELFAVGVPAPNEHGDLETESLKSAALFVGLHNAETVLGYGLFNRHSIGTPVLVLL